MPKYYQYKVAGYYLYFTTACIVEAMHVHASDKKLTQEGSAKFFVKANGDTTVEKKGVLSVHEINEIRKFIKIHYMEMFEIWSIPSDNGFYGE
ncbi:MAG: DUF4160 domain-containing protein [Clostridiales bacterium]|nr:DUF4160 domain-containing protein [Clostridiales bacterium]